MLLFMQLITNIMCHNMIILNYTYMWLGKQSVQVGT